MTDAVARQAEGVGPGATLGQLGLGSGRLAAAHTVMDEAEAIALTRARWSIDVVAATRLATEKDDTFRLDTAEGERFVVKVSHPDEDDDEVAFETELMRHVHESGYRVPVPALLPSAGGRLLEPVRDGAGRHRLARAMTFAVGTPLDTTGTSAPERERVGEMLAQLRYATADFRHPADGRVCAWDVRHLTALRPLLDEVPDPAQRQALARGLARFTDVVVPQLPSLRSHVLHNDFSTSNLLVDHDAAEFVTGVIDFGDAVHTAIAVDVATALLNQLPRDAARRPVPDLFAEARDVLRGYLRCADLTEAELALLPHLVMGRVVARALITLHRASLIPGNTTYILRNTAPGWGQLAWFLDRTPDEISSTFL
ncbi:phosphotransferase enzyme family protein [Streptomyces sp. NPDC102360]|uniref:phosphotransferase enzyme family protein n=1 Tax=Streptomyces sp. NPDC102360 TaxID=3366160 RepID=UPI00380CC45B